MAGARTLARRIISQQRKTEPSERPVERSLRSGSVGDERGAGDQACGVPAALGIEGAALAAICCSRARAVMPLTPPKFMLSTADDGTITVAVPPVFITS